MARPGQGWISGMLVALAVLSAACGKKEEAPPPPPPAVEVAPVTQKDVPVFGEWIGSLDGFVNAQIRPQIEGYVLRRNYQEGYLVKAGQAPLRDRSPPVPGDLRPGQGHPGPERGHAREREDDGRALQAAGRGEGDQPAGAGRRRDARADGAGQRRERSGEPREGEAGSRLDEGRLPDRRDRGRRRLAGRRSRQPPGRHDHGLAGGSHQGVLQSERAGVPGTGSPSTARSRRRSQGRPEPREGPAASSFSRTARSSRTAGSRSSSAARWT